MSIFSLVYVKQKMTKIDKVILCVLNQFNECTCCGAYIFILALFSMLFLRTNKFRNNFAIEMHTAHNYEHSSRRVAYE